MWNCEECGTSDTYRHRAGCSQQGSGFFTLAIRENGIAIDQQQIVDPFIHTTIELGRSRWQRIKAAWEVLRGKTFTVHVDGDRAAVGDVMRLIGSWETVPPTREGPSVRVGTNG